MARYGNLVAAITRAHGLAAADAADVAQTTWLRLHINLHRIRDPDRLPAWIATTTRRECRRQVARSLRELPLAEDVERVDDRTPADALLAYEQQRALRDAVRTLPPRCQELLALLAHDPPLDYQAIAGRLGVPVGSIGPTRGRCLARLRAELTEERRQQDPPGTPAENAA